MTLRVRWLGRVAFADAHALQRGLLSASTDDHLLLLEHPHVYTLGLRADPDHVLVAPGDVGAELIRTDRGGDVTYHGPGQLVGYPVLNVAPKHPGGRPDSVSWVRSVEGLVIETLADLGVSADRLDGYPGVWLGVGTDRPRKICAVGVRLVRGRSMHGFALNVNPDLAMFDHIVPCGIADKGVTSLTAEGVHVPMRGVVDALCRRAVAHWGSGGWERHDVAWRERTTDLSPFSRGAGPGERADRPSRSRLRLAEAGVAEGLEISARKPDWVKARVRISDDYRRVKRTMRDLDLVTVCEEAGCPNISECWSDGTATFMINGERCTRACGFCLVDTRLPEAPDPGEPERVAEAVDRMDLSFAVVTAVARDDQGDGGAAGFAATIEAVRRRRPHVQVEVLIPDCKGDPDALGVVFAARPDVLAHNIETVPRLQRAVRPSASYARSLSVLARAKAAGLITKSSIIVGLGEEVSEVEATLADLAGVGVDIVTVGQYLRPTTHHLPVARWWTPAEFAQLQACGERLGLRHLEASPLTRSSYHARQAAAGVTPTPAA